MPLHPQAVAWMDELRVAGARPIFELPLADARQLVEDRVERIFPEAQPVAAVEDVSAGGVPVRVYRPADGEQPALLWIHGGGWVVGSVYSSDHLCRALAARSGCTVISVDYRRAPEDKFPAAVDDCWTAVNWATKQFGRVAVGGDSAGGNLAAVCALRARNVGVNLALQLLVYPITDCDFDTNSYVEWAEGTPLTRDGMRWYWQCYMPDAASSVDPEASPLRAIDVAGTAPAYVVVAECDPLRDEAEAYARRLQQAGVTVTICRYDGQIHGFFSMPGVFDEAGPAIENAAAALRVALAPASDADRRTIASARASGDVNHASREP